jgi:chemotaxis family two-component system sensor kinase Cph1
MVAGTQSQPAFGQADLSNCEREQIHLAGSVQPHGALLVVRDNDLKIVQSSANAAEFLGVPAVLDRQLADLGGNLAEEVRRRLGEPLHSIARAVRCRIGATAAQWDGLIHKPSGGGIIVELEPAGPPVDLLKHMKGGLDRVTASNSLRELCNETAALYKQLTGYDRVMVYRFDDQGHGEVLAEEKEAHLEAYLGNRYPASDIPQMARRLYEKNRVRVLKDVDYRPVPLHPRLSPFTGKDLDMSLCFLRSMSPIHMQYLKNMGVVATLVVSIIVGGKLWGLVACHHYEPRFVHYEARAVCELLAEIVATRIAALESFTITQADLSVRRLEQRMAEAIARHGNWRTALFDSPQSLLSPTRADGAALLFESETFTTGEVPGTQQLRQICDWLDTRPRAALFATASLTLDQPALAALKPIASGLLAVPISPDRGEYLLWFRMERVRTVTWGGNPQKPVVVGNDPADLSPRRSFAQWRELVEGTSEPWSPADLAAGRHIGEAVADFVLQFRSVRMLIAADQLEQVSNQLRSCGQPVVIVNSDGRVLLLNQAFARLLPAAHGHVEWMDDLGAAFENAIEAREALRASLTRGSRWVGELRLRGAFGDGPILRIRADPVVSSSGTTLGVVLLGTDLSELQNIDAARQRFQESIVAHHRVGSAPLDRATNLVYRNLLSRIVGNAQVAALEITDGVELGSVPLLLEQLRLSVARSSQLLEHLVAHSADARQDPPQKR